MITAKDKLEKMISDLNTAKKILRDYSSSETSVFIDIGNVFYSATEYEKAFDLVAPLLLEALEMAEFNKEID